ncbi:MAG: hypothetical protein ACJAUV_001222 [Flavobacteriales bacterium]|jgi:hypothetical protein
MMTIKLQHSVLVAIIALSSFISNKALSQASCDLPDYCNRMCWSPSNNHPPQSNPSYTSPTHIIVHHSGDNQIWPDGTNYAAVVRAYWDQHVNTNGWSDIGYNWLIDRNGIIYEGRGNSIQGAHFSCMNSNTMGTCVIGNFNLESTSSQAISSLENLLAWEASDKGISVMDASLHNSSELVLSNICGHRDGNASNATQSCASGTVCPGNNLYASLTSVRNGINNMPCYNGTSDIKVELPNEKVTLYPTVTKGLITIEGIIANELFQITTLSGKIVKQGNVTNTLDISELSNGLYLFRLPKRTIPISVKIHKE